MLRAVDVSSVGTIKRSDKRSETRDVADLVGAARRGSRSAFELLVERYQRLVFSVSYAMTGSLIDAEEIAQDTFVTAWSRLSELRRPDRFRNWICTIARTRSVGQLRARQRRGGDLDSLDDGVETSGEPSALEQIITREEEAAVRRALKALPEAYRLPLVLYYQESRSVEAVAEALDLSVDNVWQRLSRGRKILQEHLFTALETSLTKLRPGKTFTAAVLAAVAANLESTATAATAASGLRRTGKVVSTKTLAAGALVVAVGGLIMWLQRRPSSGHDAANGDDHKAVSAQILPPFVPARTTPLQEDGAREPGPAGVRKKVPTLFDFDFEDGLLPESFTLGHVAAFARGPGNQYVAMPNVMLGEKPFNDESYYDTMMIVELRPKDLYYRDTLVVSVDYWPGDNYRFAVEIYNVDRKSNYIHTIMWPPGGRWQNLTIPISSLTPVLADGPMQPGDKIRTIKLIGGVINSRDPLMIDNLRIYDDPQKVPPVRDDSP